MTRPYIGSDEHWQDSVNAFYDRLEERERQQQKEMEPQPEKHVPTAHRVLYEILHNFSSGNIGFEEAIQEIIDGLNHKNGFIVDSSQLSKGEQLQLSMLLTDKLRITINDRD